MKSCHTRLTGWSVASTLSLFAAVAFAGSAAAVQTHNYGNFNAGNVSFNNVVETADDAPHPAPPLFGGDGVFVGADELVFDPSGAYVAERNSGVEGAGTTTVASTLDLDVEVNDDQNFHITKITLRETGDFNISQDALATVGATLQMRVTEIDGSSQILPQWSHTMTFTPAGANGNGSYDSSDSCGTGTPPCAPGGSLTNYSGILEFDVHSALVNEVGSGGFSRGVTAIEIFTVDNDLNAIIPVGGVGSAKIQKKGFEIEVVAVPEPGTALLVGLGLVGLAARARRRA